MKSVSMKMLCRFLAVAMVSLSIQTASAGIIATSQAAAVASAPTERALVLSALDRSDVGNLLLAQGVDPADAYARVAAMTDQEVHSLAGNMATAPAGADATFLALVAGGVIVWYLFYRR